MTAAAIADWPDSGSWDAIAADSQRGFVGVDQDPSVEEFMMADGPAVVVLAGSTVRVIPTGSGELVYEGSGVPHSAFPFV